MKENNNEKEKEEKQNYLIKEIMDKNYDTEKFTDYISKLKENGDNVDNWTFDGLKKVVSSFKNKVKTNQLNNEENIEKEVENIRNSFILIGSEKNKKLNNNNENPYDKIFNDKGNDFKNVKNTLSDLTNVDKNKIKIEGFEDYEIIDSSEFIDSSSDKLICIKQKENSLSKLDNLHVEVQR